MRSFDHDTFGNQHFHGLRKVGAVYNSWITTYTVYILVFLAEDL